MANKNYKYRNGSLVSEDTEELLIPDEAIHYVVSNFLQGKTVKGGAPVIIGVTTSDVENVLQLFVNWADRNGYIKGGILTIGGYKIDK